MYDEKGIDKKYLLYERVVQCAQSRFIAEDLSERKKSCTKHNVCDNFMFYIFSWVISLLPRESGRELQATEFCIMRESLQSQCIFPLFLVIHFRTQRMSNIKIYLCFMFLFLINGTNHYFSLIRNLYK